MDHEHIHYVDWLKVLIVYGILVFHASLVFSVGGAWLVSNPQRDLLLSAFAGFCFVWGIPAMFLIAGADAWFGLRSHSPVEFIKGRVERLLIPLAIGFIVLSPFQRYLVSDNPPPPIGRLPAFYEEFFRGLGSQFSWQWVTSYWTHLWFLAYLLAISFACLPFLAWLRGTGGRRFTAALVRVTGRRGGLFLLGAPLLVSQLVLRPIFPAYQGWADAATYTVVFAAGAVLFSNRGFEAAIRRDVRLFLLTGTAAIAAIGIILYLTPDHQVRWGGSPPAIALVYASLWALDIWSWLMAVLCLGVRWLDRPSRVLTYTQESVLPFYVLHHPVVLLLASFVVAENLGVWPKFAFIVGGGFAVTIGIYELAVRRWTVTRFLFGLKVRRRTTPASSANARVTPAVSA